MCGQVALPGEHGNAALRFQRQSAVERASPLSAKFSDHPNDGEDDGDDPKHMQENAGYRQSDAQHDPYDEQEKREEKKFTHYFRG